MIDAILTHLRSRFTLTKYQDCWLADATHLLNIRWKSKPVYSRIRKRKEFGLPKSRYDAYLAMLYPVVLIVGEKETAKVWFAELAKVSRYAVEYLADNAPDNGGTVFLPVSAFEVLLELKL
jgi:hypothetical protein